ncbi:hypothetical protein [Dickeya solani]|uniref:Uncharacterized protein n=1 Tax=Dickeya solani TaxID=1089444 RepID=A0ABU4EL73_9GAMM|nr:hypothetical protein [Dickeya solani]MCA6998198.1 hypothetical protein [Dickeya solani]MDV6997171.1 hypothetical protein [Dickeya solani]MDV7004482.1 hypothetical protein [Dickeya solani]MDV7040356.1 hypothetical protein [Dickeya solani]MDV7044807.1 hypothetical protein [Dickeya solani]
MATLNEVFGRKNNDGNIEVLFKDDGVAVTRLDVDNIYPVDSQLSTRYEHAGGITITHQDASSIGIEIE